MSGKLYIMRHGRTDWNDRHKLQGQTETELNEAGRKMAAAAAVEYKNVNFDTVFCSPLKRAVETAQIVLEGRNIPLIIDERLKEVSFGIYEGIENSFDIPDCPVNRFFFEPEKYTKAPEGAENIDELMARTGEFLKEKVEPELNAGRDVLIVGHGAMNSAIITQVKNRDKSEFWKDGIENCKLMRLK